MEIQEVFEELVEAEEKRRTATIKAALLCSGYLVKFLEIVEPGCTAKLATLGELPHQEYTRQIGSNIVSMRVVKSDTERVAPVASSTEIEEMLTVGRWMVESVKLAYVTITSAIPELKDFGLTVVKGNGDIVFERNPQYTLRIVAEQKVTQ